MHASLLRSVCGAWLLGAASLACAGKTDESSKSNACDGLAGNYDISLEPATGSADATKLTLRLSSKSGACVARVTPAGYPAVELEAAVGANAIELDDTTGPELPTLTTGWYWGLHFFREYHFRHVTLPRTSSGAFDGTAHATVDVAWAEDDICSVGELEWSGSVGPDGTPPTLYVGPPLVYAPKRPDPGSCFSASGGKVRPGMPEQALPWDPVALEASEPLAGLASASTAAHTLGFSDAVLDENTKATDVWAWATVSDWESVRGKSIEVRSEGLVDAAGLALTPTTYEVPVLDVGPAVSAHELDSADGLATFGTVAMDGEFLRVEANCNSGLGGIAGRLSTSGASKVVFRVRTDVGTTLLVEVIGVSGTHYPGGAGYDEEWHTVEVPISGESEVGFTLVPNSMCHWTTHATAWVDRIYSE
ncbi:MAG: hypothetical protein U0263_17950 [Polyangiaceae bacterium]